MLCPALSVLTLITLESRKHPSSKSGFPSLEQAIGASSGFIDSLVSRLTSPNVQVIHSALQLVNSMLLCFVLSHKTVSSPLFEALREAGLLRNASQLFENKPLAASCSPQLYDLQELVRAIFCQNMQIPVDLSNPLHNNSFKQVESMLSTLIGTTQTGTLDWTRTGLSEGQDPISEFNNTLRWAGLQDFAEFLSLDEMLFKKMYLEHLAFAPPNSRFPFTSASLAVSHIMFDIFGINDQQINKEYFSEIPESFIPPPYIVPTSSSPPLSSTDQFAFGNTSTTSSKQATTSMLSPTNSASETAVSATSTRLNKAGTSSVESELAKLGKLRPLIFDWSVLHSAGIVNFLRLWLMSSAQREDFENIIEVVRVLFSQAIPNNDFSTVSIDSVVSKLDTLSYSDIRTVQMQNIEEHLGSQWGFEIRSLHNQFQQESYDFVKEQRIRLLLRGEWFYADNPLQSTQSTTSRNSGQSMTRITGTTSAGPVAAPTARRYFVALSPSLGTLHYSEYSHRLEEHPAVEALSRTIDLATISKVVVNSLTASAAGGRKNKLRVNLRSRTNYSKITIFLTGSREGSSLVLYTDTPEKSAAWGDGLLMLKNKAYQSIETKKYIDMFSETKLRLQMMHITPDDLTYARKHPVSKMDFENVITTDDFYYT